MTKDLGQKGGKTRKNVKPGEGGEKDSVSSVGSYGAVIIRKIIASPGKGERGFLINLNWKRAQS